MNKFKEFWRQKNSPLDEVKLDILMGDLTLRMHDSTNLEDWKDLHNRYEALQIERENVMKFADFWKAVNGFEKSKLSKSELIEVQNTIAKLQGKGLPSSKIITALQKMNGKLAERWKAERAYWTEMKRAETSVVGDASEDLGLSKYRVILSPNACKTCREKTQDGKKIFKQQELEKTGYGHVPPFHPNCYCITVPQG